MPPENKPCIVFDTNVLISAALLPQSASMAALNVALATYQPVLSQAIFDELEAVIHRPHLDKYFKNGNNREEFLEFIARTHLFITPQTVVVACRDQADNKILEAAVDADAKLIISGDDDLLSMHPFKGINILKPQALFAKLQ